MKTLFAAFTVTAMSTSAFAHETPNASEVPCSVQITDAISPAAIEGNVGLAIGVSVNISAKNTTNNPVEGVNWVMKSKNGNILYSGTWVNQLQSMLFWMPHAQHKQEINTIPAGSTVTIAATNAGGTGSIHGELSIVDSNNAVNIASAKVKRLEEKYNGATCEIVDLVEKIR